MTQTKEQHTPYDAEIELLKEQGLVRRLGSFEIAAAIQLAHQREGYLVAKAEDADLLVACEMVLSFAETHPYTGLGDSKGYGVDLPSKLRAAISKAKGG